MDRAGFGHPGARCGVDGAEPSVSRCRGRDSGSGRVGAARRCRPRRCEYRHRISWRGCALRTYRTLECGRAPFRQSDASRLSATLIRSDALSRRLRCRRVGLWVVMVCIPERRVRCARARRSQGAGVTIVMESVRLRFRLYLSGECRPGLGAGRDRDAGLGRGE